jgi:hypothetical protein
MGAHLKNGPRVECAATWGVSVFRIGDSRPFEDEVTCSFSADFRDVDPKGANECVCSFGALTHFLAPLRTS